MVVPSAKRRAIQKIVEQWRKEYDQQRPHSSLKYQTPDEFTAACNQRFQATETLRKLQTTKRNLNFKVSSYRGQVSYKEQFYIHLNN
ncbi:MAG: integrase core domain-containing protein [Limisphaerales bacterium]|mgnify:FL=1|nr:hypothetical protein [Pedosphaera sp.]MBL6841865.1 transposase [Verrucomicrobiae bacterium]HAW02443.1 hypothetical protein [Verrucomicrobiales bacterium]HCP39244.1 hypothetical protein [Verrucomicrobiales bacterium]HCZ01814.1 hypothetical protein [Verrucomicrobiales bacterium]